MGDEMTKYVKCRVHIHGDTTICDACGLVWDTNDLYPPECPKFEYADNRGLLKGLAFGLPISLVLWTIIYFAIRALFNV